ncbi:MAG: hypothetical protein AAF968_04375 [Pseudomonadota bacterium]
MRERQIAARPRIEAMPSDAEIPNEPWSTDLCGARAGKDRWATLALMIDYHTRETLS